jgi:small subunit ribosomal protein S21
MKVIVKDNNVTTALRKFKKKIEDSGVLVAYMDKLHYEKPTQKRKRKKAAAKARWARTLRNQQLPEKKY